jgi:YD repeat-containing protein
MPGYSHNHWFGFWRAGHWGNLVAEKTGATVTRAYTWDSENHLLSIHLTEAGQDVTVAYSYDDQGTLVSRNAGSNATRYLTDYANPTGYSQTLAELDATGTKTQVDYVYGVYLLAQTVNGNSQTFFHGDHLGSVRMLSDAAGSAVSGGDYNYTPFGELSAGPSALTSYAFTGQRRDGVSGLQYHRARWSNTAKMSWGSVDASF